MDIKKLIEILIELRSESMNISSNPTESAVKLLTHKYNILFLGKKFNHIDSVELWNTLKNYYHFEITLDELNSLVPEACKILNMECEPRIELGKLGKTSKPGCYGITLW